LFVIVIWTCVALSAAHEVLLMSHSCEILLALVVHLRELAAFRCGSLHGVHVACNAEWSHSPVWLDDLSRVAVIPAHKAWLIRTRAICCTRCSRGYNSLRSFAHGNLHCGHVALCPVCIAHVALCASAVCAFQLEPTPRGNVVLQCGLHQARHKPALPCCFALQLADFDMKLRTSAALQSSRQIRDFAGQAQQYRDEQARKKQDRKQKRNYFMLKIRMGFMHLFILGMVHDDSAVCVDMLILVLSSPKKCAV